MGEVEVIHSWSTPRSLSTSLMYSFAQRDDIEVLDEPLYANFLRVTGVEMPYLNEVLSKMVWTTGTMGEITPVLMIDGRVIGDGKVGPVTKQIQHAYKAITEDSGVLIPRSETA